MTMGVHACMTPRGKERTNERTKWRQPQQQRTARTIIIITIITTMMNRYRKPTGTMQRRQSKARLTTLVTLTSAMMDTSVRIVDVAPVSGLKKKRRIERLRRQRVSARKDLSFGRCRRWSRVFLWRASRQTVLLRVFFLPDR